MKYILLRLQVQTDFLTRRDKGTKKIYWGETVAHKLISCLPKIEKYKSLAIVRDTTLHHFIGVLCTFSSQCYIMTPKWKSVTQPLHKELERHDTYPHAQDSNEKEMGSGSKHSSHGDPNGARS